MVDAFYARHAAGIWIRWFIVCCFGAAGATALLAILIGALLYASDVLAW